MSGEKACPSLVATPCSPTPNAKPTCRCVYQRDLGLACAHWHASELALPLLTPVEERAAPGERVEMLCPLVHVSVCVVARGLNLGAAPLSKSLSTVWRCRLSTTPTQGYPSSLCCRREEDSRISSQSCPPSAGAPAPAPSYAAASFRSLFPSPLPPRSPCQPQPVPQG